MELILTDLIPLDYVKNLYGRFHVEDPKRAIEVVEKCKLNTYHRMTDKNPFLQEENWMDYLLENEELPTFA